ncbi:hypothetical protein [Deefgea piscis]|uniref:hypothetical protein n=1 Tax=Deefgea piscis TaxID=2739061 RepID=UPI001C825574|nr:hypothetical protein [Deefgea piscis]QZA82250.1 hypothetical protein K4H25_06305 [Deefgea piscis]
MEQKKEDRAQNFEREAIYAATSVLEKYSQGVAEHINSYDELAKISKYKLNPDFEQNNLFQQSGFSAEVKDIARGNAEYWIDGKGDLRARTDNVGAVNHPVYDFVSIDPETGLPLRDINGDFLPGGQMKVHQDTEKYRYLYKKSYEKYRTAELRFPADQFDAILQDWAEQEVKLETQLRKLQELGDTAQAAQKQNELEQLRDVRKRATKSKITTTDAMDARKSPEISAFKDGTKVAHRAGVNAAKSAVVITGIVGLATQGCKVVSGEKSAADATQAVLKDAGSAAAKAYVAGATTSAVGGALKTANSQVLQNLGKGGTPAVIVQTSTILAVAVVDLVRGKITSEEFVGQISRNGVTLATSLTGANLGALIGTAALPGVGTVVGSFIGGMAASLLSGSMYAALQKSVQDMQLSDENRKNVEAACAKLIMMHIAYRHDMHLLFDEFFQEKQAQLKWAFDKIADASANGESIHEGLAGVANAFGKELAFESTQSLRLHLQSKEALRF